MGGLGVTIASDPRPAVSPRLVESSSLPVYPISREDRLDGHAFVKWWHHRWISSRTFKLASWEAQGMARALFDMAQSESPIGTLPDHDDELAVMLRIDARRIAELRRQEFGPFRGWAPCLCEGEVRLMHPVVLEQVQDALDRREVRGLSKAAAAERQRLKRLRAGLAQIEGLAPAAAADDVLVKRMDDWLLVNRRGRRDQAAYKAAFVHAARMGWCGGRRAD
jgi:hypothetical protein